LVGLFPGLYGFQHWLRGKGNPAGGGKDTAVQPVKKSGVLATTEGVIRGSRGRAEGGVADETGEASDEAVERFYLLLDKSGLD
jgi:hypothetical protein